MAGQAFYKYFKERDFTVLGVARSGSDINLDLSCHYSDLEGIFSSFRPSIVVNCAALVSLSLCEENPILSYKINSLLPKKLAISSDLYGFKLVHISTDHYYLLEETPALHVENDTVYLINIYAKSKYLGELYAASSDRSLIVRTNITGFRNFYSRPTFVEWLIESIQSSARIQLFTDFYTSTIDVSTFCRFVHLLIQESCTGLFNIASSESISKFQFASLLAKQMCVGLTAVVESSVEGLQPKRATDLGLDCSKAESSLGLAMPSSEDVVRSLLQEYNSL